MYYNTFKLPKHRKFLYNIKVNRQVLVNTIFKLNKKTNFKLIFVLSNDRKTKNEINFLSLIV